MKRELIGFDRFRADILGLGEISAGSSFTSRLRGVLEMK